jgi:hypothetical protein
MKNVTVTMNEDVACWAKVHAAKMDMSLSRMLGETLKEKMRAEEDYEQAMNRFFSRPLRVLRENAEPLPSRESLYDR